MRIWIIGEEAFQRAPGARSLLLSLGFAFSAHGSCEVLLLTFTDWVRFASGANDPSDSVAGFLVVSPRYSIAGSELSARKLNMPELAKLLSTRMSSLTTQNCQNQGELVQM